MKFYGTWLWKSMNMHICECNTSAILVDCSDACLPFCVILSYICKRSEWVWQNRTNSLLLMSWLSSPTAARKKKIWIPHKIMVNRTTCRKLSPNIWKTLIIMIINGNKENTLSKVIYKLFQFFVTYFWKLYTLRLPTSICYVWGTGPQDLLHELWGHILCGKNSLHPLQCISST